MRIAEGVAGQWGHVRGGVGYSGGGYADKVQMVLGRIGAFFNRLKTIAEQLSPEAIWAIILSVAFRVWLKGKALHPVVEGNQTLLLLTH